MFGLILLFFIGRHYYRLAEKHDKNKWGYAFLGIVAYYVGTLLFGLIVGVIMEIVSPGYLETISDSALGLIALPFGILASYVLYILLKKDWENKFNSASALNEVTIVDDNSIVNDDIKNLE